MCKSLKVENELKCKLELLQKLKGAPETTLIGVGGLLNLGWEFAHSSLYTDGTGDAWYIIWTRIHCTVGDIMILLSVFYMVSLIYRSRYWWVGNQVIPIVLFVMLGFGYTVWSEWYNTQVAKTWEYAANMPTSFGIGVSPLLQWLVIPPLTLLRLKRIDKKQRRNV